MHDVLKFNNPGQSQHRYINERISGVDIDLAIIDAVHSFSGCKIEDSVIRVNSDSKSTPFILSGNVWVDCLFTPKRELSLSTIQSDFINCTFKGKWSGRIDGTVEACDFSCADLLNFAFYKSVDNTFSDAGTVIINNAGMNHAEVKALLKGISNIGIHIRPEMQQFVFSIEKQKNRAEVLKVLSALDYVRLPIV